MLHKFKKVIRYLFDAVEKLFAKFFPLVRLVRETKRSQTPVTYKFYFIQKFFGFNKKAYWPMHHSSTVTHVQNILAGVDTSPGFMHGCYIQGRGGIVIGDYTQISCNVGIISENHSFYDCRLHVEPPSFPSVVIGKHCWLGMNSMIVPGVKLGDFTVVGAGSVVTKSFEEGFCIIAGSPAKIIKKLDRNDCEYFKNEVEYHGFITKENFQAYRERYLKI